MDLEAVRENLHTYTKFQSVSVIREEIGDKGLRFSQSQKDFLVRTDSNAYGEASETQFLFGIAGVNTPELLKELKDIDVNNPDDKAEAWVKRMGEYLGDVTAKLQWTLEAKEIGDLTSDESIVERAEILAHTIRNYRVMFQPDENGSLGKHLYALSRDILKPLQNHIAEHGLTTSQTFPYEGTDYFQEPIEPEIWISLKDEGSDPDLDRYFEA